MAVVVVNILNQCCVVEQQCWHFLVNGVLFLIKIESLGWKGHANSPTALVMLYSF